MERPDKSLRQALNKENQRNSASIGLGSDPKNGGRHDRAGAGQFED